MTTKTKKKPVKKDPTPAPAADAPPKPPTEKEVEERTKAMLPTKSLGGFVPKTFPELKEMAQVLANSDLVPKGLKGKPADVMICIMHGLEVGVTPAQAMSNIMVVNGRPSIWGDLALGLVRRSQLLVDFKEDPPDKALKQGFGKCHAKRVNGEEAEYTFSIGDATRAKLINKPGPWQEYRGRMLQVRARSWILRDLFGDVLKGLAIVEEQRDVPMKDATTSAPMPKRASDKVRKNAMPGQTAPAADALEDTPKDTPKDDPKPGEEQGILTAEFVPGGVASTTLGGENVFSIRRPGDNKRFYSKEESVAKLAKGAAESKKKVRVHYDEDKDQIARIEQIELV